MYQNTHIKFQFKDPEGSVGMIIYLNIHDILDLKFDAVGGILTFRTSTLIGEWGPGWSVDIDPKTNKPRGFLKDGKGQPVLDENGQRIPLEKESQFTGTMKAYEMRITSQEVITEIMRQWDPSSVDADGLYEGFKLHTVMKAKIVKAKEKKEQDDIDAKNEQLRKLQQGRGEEPAPAGIVDAQGNPTGDQKEPEGKVVSIIQP